MRILELKTYSKMITCFQTKNEGVFFCFLTKTFSCLKFSSQAPQQAEPPGIWTRFMMGLSLKEKFFSIFWADESGKLLMPSDVGDSWNLSSVLVECTVRFLESPGLLTSGFSASTLVSLVLLKQPFMLKTKRILSRASRILFEQFVHCSQIYFAIWTRGPERGLEVSALHLRFKGFSWLNN